jgi:hypothetical protein
MPSPEVAATPFLGMYDEGLGDAMGRQVDAFPGWAVSGGRGTPEAFAELEANVPAEERAFYDSPLFRDWDGGGWDAIRSRPDPAAALRLLGLHLMPDAGLQRSVRGLGALALGPCGAGAGGATDGGGEDGIADELATLRATLAKPELAEATRADVLRQIAELERTARLRFYEDGELAAKTRMGDTSEIDPEWLAARPAREGGAGTRNFERFVVEGRETSGAEAQAFLAKARDAGRLPAHHEAGRYVVTTKLYLDEEGRDLRREQWTLLPEGDPDRAARIAATTLAWDDDGPGVDDGIGVGPAGWADAPRVSPQTRPRGSRGSAADAFAFDAHAEAQDVVDAVVPAVRPSRDQQQKALPTIRPRSMRTVVGIGGRRDELMGKTPPKLSPTGREVMSRMMSEGEMRQGRANNLEVQYVEPSTGRVSWVPYRATDMGHIEAAVTWWNRVGKYFGKRAPRVREFMRDSTNYKLEPRGVNRSNGAKMRERYDPPMPRKQGRRK